MLTRMRLWTILLIIVILFLLSIGLVMIYSTTFEGEGNFYFYRQAEWILLGGMVGIAMMFVRLEWISKYTHYFLIAVGLALGYLLLCRVIGKAISMELAVKMPFIPGEIKGGFRWLRLPGNFTVQPSEFAKVGLLMFLGAYYGTRTDEAIGKFKSGVLIPGLLSGIILIGILGGKDLSSTVITAIMVFSMMFLAGVRLRYLLPILVLGASLGVAMVVTSPMRMARVTSFMAESSGGMDKGNRYQLDHSEMALGGGGLTGRGFTKSLMKKDYLPESHTDFIVAVLGEELGFVGVSVTMGLYFLFFFLVWGISKGCHDRVGMLICQGVAVLIPFQAVINAGVVSGFLPTTGLTAPLLSYGGSSMMATLMCVGLVFNVALRNMTAISLENQQMHVVALPNVYRSLRSKQEEDE